jgi:hypothetical protein
MRRIVIGNEYEWLAGYLRAFTHAAVASIVIFVIAMIVCRRVMELAHLRAVVKSHERPWR